MTREDILTELVEMGIQLRGGSVYGPKTLRIISFDFHGLDGVRFGLSLAWFESVRVTARVIAEGIRDLKRKADKLEARDLWIPSAGQMFLRDNGTDGLQWVSAPWTLPRRG